MVNDVMVERRRELVKAADEMSELAKKSVGEGGLSYCNFNRLVEDIHKMNEMPCMRSEINVYVADEFKI